MTQELATVHHAKFRCPRAGGKTSTAWPRVDCKACQQRRPPAGRPRNGRAAREAWVGAPWDEALVLEARYAALTGERASIGQYVEDALTAHNQRMRKTLEALATTPGGKL